MRTSVLLFVPFFAACQESAVTKFNANPDAVITSHVDGDTVLEGEPELLTGQVGDPDDDVADDARRLGPEGTHPARTVFVRTYWRASGLAALVGRLLLRGLVEVDKVRGLCVRRLVRGVTWRDASGMCGGG